MGSITSSNAVLTLAIATLFPIPQQLHGFGTDDIYDIPRIRSVEIMMGVDGVLSGGFIYAAVPMEITLQADSLSNRIFDTWNSQMQAAGETYIAQGNIRLPGVATKFALLTGFLTGYSPSPAAKKVLQPRRYEITWQKIAPAPV
jgi:hypothetical protein